MNSIIDKQLSRIQVYKNSDALLAKAFEFEALAKAAPQVELRIEHHFSLGVYARTMYMPKGVVVVGKLHKYPQLNILSQGDVSVWIDGEVKRFKAPFIYSAPAGVKRVLHAHEDVVWTTILGTHETDVDKIEQKFTAETELEYLEFTLLKPLIENLENTLTIEHVTKAKEFLKDS